MLLLLAFFVAAQIEAWQAAHKKPEGFPQEVLAATAALNGCIGFAHKAFLSPLGILTIIIFFLLRKNAKKEEKAKTERVDTKTDTCPP
jgi:hypothetical protein